MPMLDSLPYYELPPGLSKPVKSVLGKYQVRRGEIMFQWNGFILPLDREDLELWSHCADVEACANGVVKAKNAYGRPAIVSRLALAGIDTGNMAEMTVWEEEVIKGSIGQSTNPLNPFWVQASYEAVIPELLGKRGQQLLEMFLDPLAPSVDPFTALKVQVRGTSPAELELQLMEEQLRVGQISPVDFAKTCLDHS